MHLPCGLLLKPWHIWHIKHDSEEKQRLISEFVQMFLQRFLQLHPSCLLALAEKPKAKVVRLEERVKRHQFMLTRAIPRPHRKRDSRASRHLRFPSPPTRVSFYFLSLGRIKKKSHAHNTVTCTESAEAIFTLTAAVCTRGHRCTYVR